jgi:hypothetical protein
MTLTATGLAKAENTEMSQARAAVDWCFRDRKTGRIVVAQFPNVSLGVWLAVQALRLVRDNGRTEVLGWIAAGALLVWGLDELLRGVNPWRRLVGAAAVTYQTVIIVRGA